MWSKDEKVVKYLASIYDPITGEYRPTRWRRFVWSLQDKIDRNRVDIMVTAIVIGTFAAALFSSTFLFGFEGTAAALFALVAMMAVMSIMFVWGVRRNRRQAQRHSRVRGGKKHTCGGNPKICRGGLRFNKRLTLDDDPAEADRRIRELGDPESYTDGT